MGSDEAKAIEYGDAAYDAIYAEWVRVGRPGRFQRMGEWGGAIYTVLELGEEYPTIYQSYSLPPTLWDDDSYSERPSQEGFWHINRKYWGLDIDQHPDGRFRMRVNDSPPNELNPEDTI